MLYISSISYGQRQSNDGMDDGSAKKKPGPLPVADPELMSCAFK
jgi:hypothetical protein